MNVNSELLRNAISYSEGVPVAEANRVLKFYIEVSPLASITFTTTKGEDVNIGLRKIIANDIALRIGAYFHDKMSLQR